MIQIDKVNDIILNGRVILPSSKSESNRYLVIQALNRNVFNINGLSDCNDTSLLQKAIQGNESIVDFEDAATPMRFFLAFAALRDRRIIITGNKGLQTRTIAPLVDALSQLGCRIEYLGEKGFVPVKIHKGIDKEISNVTIDGSKSSQFISALLLVAPVLTNGLTIELTGDGSSTPYINLTIDCMKKAGANVVSEGNKFIVPAQIYYRSAEVAIEPDWSAATFLYAWVAVVKNADIFLPGLRLDSLQGDRVTAYLFEFFGVKTTVMDDGIRIAHTGNSVPKIKVDFTAIPDMFPAVAAVCAFQKIEATFTGIQNLATKESNRVMAMKENLSQTGAILSLEDGRAFLSFSDKVSEDFQFKSFNDHRIVMACSIFAIQKKVTIDNESVVVKSFPGYWEMLKMLTIIK